MAFPERTLIGRFRHTGALSKGGFWNPTPVLTTEPSPLQGMLNGKQVGELTEIIVRSPTNIDGTGDYLGAVSVAIDGGNPNKYLLLPGRLDSCFTPPTRRIREERPRFLRYVLGQPTWNPDGYANPLDQITGPKFITSCVPYVYADPDNATSQPFEVEFWGYVYDAVFLAGTMPTYNPDDVVVDDRANNRSFTLRGRPINGDNNWRLHWKELPGGDDQTVSARASDGQATTKIFAWVREALNSNPILTTAGYQFNYSGTGATQGVSTQQQNLFWELEDTQAIILERMGVRGPAPVSATAGTPTSDLLTAWVNTDQQTTQKRHPNRGIPVNYDRNEAHYGLRGGEKDLVDPLPWLPQRRQLLWNETAYISVQSRVGNLDASTVRVAAAGLYAVSGKENTLF
ncbi:MAG: hypothetical protein ACYCT1_08380 [Steroidobacteraceae bacterium]